MCNFSTQDVLTIAKAVAEDPLNYQDGDHVPYFWCDYCKSELKGYSAGRKDFEHELSCPVLAAQDILTGF